MRALIGTVLIAVMRGVFTVISRVFLVTQHRFANTTLGALVVGAVATAQRPRVAAGLGDRLPAPSAPRDISQAALRRRRVAPARRDAGHE